MASSIRENVLQANIPKHVVLMAATKGRSVEEIKQVIAVGITHIGENTIQEAAKKFPALQQQGLTKHFIGHLQSNKAKKAVELFDMIQSIDSEKIAEKVNEAAAKIGKKMLIMIQVNIGKEKTKHGVVPERVMELYQTIKKLPNISIIGLMCIAPEIPADQTRPYFRKMKELNDILKLQYLSMGMSNDYKIAIEEGSNMVRLGRIIFDDEWGGEVAIFK
ncbi:YggS family pyridoxal phosphate-dependent enzyme [Candidatus Woesearchaeota archaeon]|nr:YggS family pyridoxal phosphate-dependent enzyme [Candidatus Woesearchaeota archaeon]